MNAQFLYNMRGKWEFCSGTTLAEFFAAEVGDPSPAGKVNIDPTRAKMFVTRCLAAMEHNAQSLKDHCEKARRALQRALHGEKNEQEMHVQESPRR